MDILENYLLLPFKDIELPMDEKIEIALSVPYRHITQFKVLSSFKCPGRCWIRTGRRIPGIKRTPHVGSSAYLRVDDRDPSVMDFEFQYQDGRKWTWTTYTLTEAEFNSIRQFLSEEQEVCKHESVRT